MNGLHLLPGIILAPFVAVLILLFIPSTARNAIRGIALAAASCSLALATLAMFTYDNASKGLQFVEHVPWLTTFGISLDLGVDGLSLPLVLLTAIILFAGVFVSWKLESRAKEFFIYTLLLVGGVFGVFMSTDLFVLFMFIEVAVIPKYVLISVWGSTRKDYAAMKYTLYLLSGSAIAFVGLFAVYTYVGSPHTGLGYGTFSLAELAKVNFSPEFQKWGFLAILVGFGVLVPIFPLHRWTPDGHSAAPTTISMLLAGVIMKLGGYAIIRVGLGFFPMGAQYWAPVVAILAAINVIYIAFVALAQKDMKFVVANSSISHMGFVLLGIASMNAVSLSGAAAQMFAHGIMAALFFALVGQVYDKAHTRIIADFGGLAKYMPRTSAAFLVVGLASLGLPGLFNFVPEFTVFAGSIQSFTVLTIVSVFSVVVTAIYVLWVYQRVFLGPANERWAGLSDARGIELVPIVLLGGVLLVLGVWPGPFMDMVSGGIMPIVGRIVAAPMGGIF
ncbi:MAG: NADH-quinone oxidoreductase subunit M [Spirochaetota bacterium]